MKNTAHTVEGFIPSKPLDIAEPCNESWEDMPGDQRRRFCSRCGHDVVNTAAMTPAAIEAMIESPGPLPCMRVVQYGDGSLRTARESAPVPMRTAAAIAASAFVSLAALAGSAQQPVMGKMMPISAPATLVGEVHGVDGKPAAGVRVLLTPIDGTQTTVPVTTDGNGRFSFTTRPGKWTVRAESSTVGRMLRSNVLNTDLKPGANQAAAVLQLQPERVLMGAPPLRPSASNKTSPR